MNDVLGKKQGESVMAQQSDVERFETLIVGAGPAGLQLGYFLGKAGRSYLILERNERPGSFYERFPRHRTLISINKRFNGYPEKDFNLRHDWNSLISDDDSLLFTKYSKELFPHADDLCRYMADFTERHGIQVRFKSQVCKIQRDAETGVFTVVDTEGRAFSCRRLVLGTGAVKPHVPREIEGIEHALGYEDHDIDPALYENKRVAILGRGNSAFEIANHLAGSAAIIHLLVGVPIKHAWQTHYPGDLRAINNTILDMYQLKSLHAMIGFRPTKITPRPDGRFDVVMEEDYPHWETPGTGTTTTTYDYVIRATGWRFIDEDLFDASCRPMTKKEGKYPDLTSSWESTNVPGLFFIGTAMQARDRKAASAFIHGFRYNVRTLFNILEERYHGVPLPSEEFSFVDGEDLETVASFLVRRFSTVSALFQLFGFLCDVIVVADGEAKLYYELPVDFVLDDPRFKNAERIFVVTLEYGFNKYPKGASTLDFIHPADAHDTSCSAYLHPIFRCYSRGQLLEERHLGESLVVRYDEVDYKENARNMYKNTVKTILNEQCELTDETFSCEPFPPELAGEVFVQWPDDKVREWREKEVRDEMAECRFVV
ncbi:MAG: NAD(P)-binding domain-containing protein [Thermoanaerobaculia bacterium]|nr:NAD(P)-binding domain-containing protein [Thermoanaerobaculia bacterium]